MSNEDRVAAAAARARASVERAHADRDELVAIVREENAAGLSQRRLATLTGYHINTIANWCGSPELADEVEAS